MDIPVVARTSVGPWIPEPGTDRRVLCLCGPLDYPALSSFRVYTCKIKVYNNIIRGSVAVVCMANLSLSLSVAEGGPIKDTQNKVLNLVDHIIILILCSY